MRGDLCQAQLFRLSTLLSLDVSLRSSDRSTKVLYFFIFVVCSSSFGVLYHYIYIYIKKGASNTLQNSFECV